MADAPAKNPGPPHAAARDEEVSERRTLRDYYIILRERFWIALPLALLIAIGYGYKKMQVTPTYFARATMQFEKPDTVVPIQGVVDQSVRSDVDLNTHLEVLKSGMLAAQVRAALTPEEQVILKRANLKRSPPGTDPNSVGIDMGSMTPVPSRASYIIGIQVTHPDPEAAMIVANKYVDGFMNYLLTKGSTGNQGAVQILSQQAERLRKESEEADQALQRYMKEKNLLSLDSSINLVTEQLRKAAAYRDESRFRLLQIDEKMRQIEAYQAANRNLLEIAEIGTHQTVAPLKAQLSRLQQEMNLLAERYLERHPSIINKANEISVTETDLNRAVTQAIAELRTRQAEAKQAVKNSEEEYARAEKAQIELGDTSVAFRSLKTEADAKEQNYRALLARLNDARTVKNIENVPVRPLDRATLNPNPVSPDKAQIIKTSIGLGVLVFLGVAVGLSFIDDRVKSAWDVESFIGANLLGIIPDLAAMKDDEKYTLLLDNRQAPGVEAFLSVYSSIKIHSKLDFPKSILVTSTIPGEGKTLISCNVAGSFARHSKKTLLIDGDLRRPMLHRHFKQQNSAGLITWFEAGGSMEGDLATNPDLGIIKVGENLSLLCSGGRSKSPTELLENPLFSQLLERLKREYDLVIVDSPPLGAVTDSLLIAERIDEVIYVCRFNRAYRKHIRLYMRALRNGKNEVLGVVLNGLSPRRIEYYSNYRYYRSYKKYYGAQT
ncbi:MAG: polysaccharide biosynthesis tyrosine autokinase [Verrucomicrobia bacterium]|nr:polysaccharide biosynthesis tyrosine autokinase [Verrucomicrobiota bacterium]